MCHSQELNLLTRAYIRPFSSEKEGRFEKVFSFDSCHPIVTRDSRVSRAPPHHNLSAFLNPHGSNIL